MRQAVTIIALCVIALAGYIGYLAYETRNLTPYEWGTEQYNGWMYAEGNQLTDAGQCEDTDGGWAEMGIETSVYFVSGCLDWFKSR
ncbi:MAG: hypothetical protein VXW65_11780 [Pseudomonadota bacterium]|nr:hypothetical protein [Pseudomonadota bacterium]